MTRRRIIDDEGEGPVPPGAPTSPLRSPAVRFYLAMLALILIACLALLAVWVLELIGSATAQ